MATNYTQSVTAAVTALMRDRGMNPTSLANASGVPRRAIDQALFHGGDWKTSHLEALAAALNTDLAAMVSPGLKASA